MQVCGTNTVLISVECSVRNCGTGNMRGGFVRVDQESKAWAICQWPSADGGRRVWGLTPSACRRLHVLEGATVTGKLRRWS